MVLNLTINTKLLLTGNNKLFFPWHQSLLMIYRFFTAVYCPERGLSRFMLDKSNSSTFYSSFTSYNLLPVRTTSPLSRIAASSLPLSTYLPLEPLPTLPPSVLHPGYLPLPNTLLPPSPRYPLSTILLSPSTCLLPPFLPSRRLLLPLSLSSLFSHPFFFFFALCFLNLSSAKRFHYLLCLFFIVLPPPPPLFHQSSHF